MTSLLFALVFYVQQIQQGKISTTTIADYIAVEALANDVNPQMAIGVAQAESKLNTAAVGDHGTSHGVWQIHLPAHPDIKKAQAEDLVFSTEWAIREMKQNGCTAWSTCKKVMASLDP